MSALTPPQLTPVDVERASKRDGKHYELIDGALKEKPAGVESLVIVSQISARLNSTFYPPDQAKEPLIVGQGKYGG